MARFGVIFDPSCCWWVSAVIVLIKGTFTWVHRIISACKKLHHWCGFCCRFIVDCIFVWGFYSAWSPQRIRPLQTYPKSPRAVFFKAWAGWVFHSEKLSALLLIDGDWTRDPFFIESETSNYHDGFTKSGNAFKVSAVRWFLLSRFTNLQHGAIFYLVKRWTPWRKPDGPDYSQ